MKNPTTNWNRLVLRYALASCITRVFGFLVENKPESRPETRDGGCRRNLLRGPVQNLLNFFNYSYQNFDPSYIYDIHWIYINKHQFSPF